MICIGWECNSLATVLEIFATGRAWVRIDPTDHDPFPGQRPYGQKTLALLDEEGRIKAARERPFHYRAKSKVEAASNE